jgi:hypothetical protein
MEANQWKGWRKQYHERESIFMKNFHLYRISFTWVWGNVRYSETQNTKPDKVTLRFIYSSSLKLKSLDLLSESHKLLHLYLTALTR